MDDFARTRAEYVNIANVIRKHCVTPQHNAIRRLTDNIEALLAQLQPIFTHRYRMQNAHVAANDASAKEIFLQPVIELVDKIKKMTGIKIEAMKKNLLFNWKELRKQQIADPGLIGARFNLYEEQEDAVIKMIDCIKNHGRVINASDGGSGKTVMAPETAARLNLSVLIIGMAGTMPLKWIEYCRRQGVQEFSYLTWANLRGSVNLPKHLSNGQKINTPLKHGLLERTDEIIDAEKKRYVTTYTVTDRLKTAIARGLMIICDETQKAKNESLSNQALSIMATELYQTDNPDISLFGPTKSGSCMMGLSATMMDAREQTINILALFGFLDAKEKQSAFSPHGYWTFESNIFEPGPSLKRFLNLCRQLDEKTYKNVRLQTIAYRDPINLWVDKNTGFTCNPNEEGVKEPVPVSERVHWLLYMLFIKIIQDRITVAVEQKDNPDVIMDYKSVIYQINEDNDETYKELTAKLSDVRYRIEVAQIKKITNRIKKLRDEESRIMCELEEIKSSIFTEQATRVLKANPQAKVFISLNYIRSIKTIARQLHAFGVGEIYGDIDTELRECYMTLFNMPNTALRVIVAQTTTAAAGIDLHDTNGNFPRFSFISPSGSTTDLTQLMKRTKRVGVQGKVTIIIVYGGGSRETATITTTKKKVVRPLADEYDMMVDLLKRQSSRTKVLKSVAQQQVKNGVVFPADLPLFKADADGSLYKFNTEELEVLANDVKRQRHADLQNNKFQKNDYVKVIEDEKNDTNTIDDSHSNIGVITGIEPGDMYTVDIILLNGQKVVQRQLTSDSISSLASLDEITAYDQLQSKITPSKRVIKKEPIVSFPIFSLNNAVASSSSAVAASASAAAAASFMLYYTSSSDVLHVMDDENAPSVISFLTRATNAAAHAPYTGQPVSTQLGIQGGGETDASGCCCCCCCFMFAHRIVCFHVPFECPRVCNVCSLCSCAHPTAFSFCS